MSRSALVTTRWSKTKPPLSLPATSRSDGSHSCRSGWVNICSSRSSGGTAAGTQSQSASKWQSRVSVSRLAAPPQLRALDVDEVGALGQRVPFAGRLDVARQHDRQVLLGNRDRAALLAVDHRDRRAPGALARDREVVGAVAGRLAGALDRRRRRPASSSSRSGTVDPLEPGGDVAVGLVDGGDAERGGRAEAGVDQRRDDDRQLAPVGAGDRGAGVDDRDRAGVAGAPLPAARAHLLELLAHPLVADPGVDLGVARREQDEARQAGELAVRREDGERAAVAALEVELDPVGAAEDVALGGEREVVPLAARGQQLGVAVVLLQVGGDPQEPGRAPDQPHLVVAAPAAAVLDLDRGERGLAGVAPVDGGVGAVDQVRARAG